jgi:hypothetical protein
MIRNKKIGGIRDIGGVIGEKDSEVGRKLEKGQQINPSKARQFTADKEEQKDWQVDVEELERQDKGRREKGIRKLKKYLEGVAEEEKKRQEEMRKRVEEITKEKLKAQSLKLKLVEPSTKPERGSFLQRLKKKGKGAMAEARGAIAKGGG